MEEKDIEGVAQQLRKPDGEVGKQMALKMNEANKLINLSTLELLDASPNENILEIGMGNGFFAKDIVSRDPSIKYTGCDFSNTMVEEARTLNKQLIDSSQAQFFLAPANKLPVMDKTFDKIFTVNTIYFWDEPFQVLEEIKRVLKPKGKLFIGIRPKSVMENLPFTRYGFTCYSKEDIEKLLSKNGFIITKVIENEEPNQDIGGTKIKVSSLIVAAELVGHD